jgi:hypothetical protein
MGCPGARFKERHHHPAVPGRQPDSAKEKRDTFRCRAFAFDNFVRLLRALGGALGGGVLGAGGLNFALLGAGFGVTAAFVFLAGIVAARGHEIFLLRYGLKKDVLTVVRPAAGAAAAG